MGNPRLNWDALVSEHAAKLGVKAELTGEGIGRCEKVRTRCEHREYEVTASSFVKKEHCCRSEARRHQSNREHVGAVAAEKLRGRKDPIDVRLKKAEGTRRRGATKSQDDLLYVAAKDGRIKVGRVALHYTRWFDNLSLTILFGWELESWAAFKLENEIHDRFGDQRPLDPSFGKGWTEVFDIDPKILVNFIEERLQL